MRSWRIRSAAGIGTGSLAAALGGCMPLVTHSPRIENGQSVRVTAVYSAGVRSDSVAGTPLLAFPAIAFESGRAASDTNVGILGGLSILGLAVQPDLYIQAPPRMLGGLDGGIGLSGTASIPSPVDDRISAIAPYAQLGLIGHDSAGVFGTVTYAEQWLRGDDVLGTAGRTQARSWTATVSGQGAFSGHSGTLFGGVAVGKPLSSTCPATGPRCVGGQRLLSLLVGGSLTVARSDSYSRVHSSSR